MEMSSYVPVRRLSEVAAAVGIVPLESGDPRYVDVSAGRRTKDLEQLRLCLQQYDAADRRFAVIGFVGHRGCGKSTELLRLEHVLVGRFTSLHTYADEGLLTDFEYSDLFLWIVDELVRKFEADSMPLDPRLVRDVVDWLATTTSEQVETSKSEASAEAGSEAKGKVGFLIGSLAVLARLKSSIKGSTERRTAIRRELQRNIDELIRRINLLLDNAHVVLRQQGKPANLLIVVDNLDRLSPDVSERLFFKEGDLLKQLRAHLLYTAPIATVLAPKNIGNVFEATFTLPMIKVHNQGGRAYKPGIDALIEIVGHRVEIDAVFESIDVVRRLAKMCGGSVRDLMRLVYNASLSALADEKETIDLGAANGAIRKLRHDFERLLIPGQAYYPRLAQIHRTKGDGATAFADASPESVRDYREFFRELLFNGTVLEYNGEEMWYDVHPIIQEIKRFQIALSDEEA